MISGSVRDAEKPIIIVAPGGLPSVWLRVRGSHDVQSSLFTAAHQQDGYPDATESRCSLSTIQKSLLDGGVHTRLLGCDTDTLAACNLAGVKRSDVSLRRLRE